MQTDQSTISTYLEIAEELINQLETDDQIEFYTNICEKYADKIMNLKGFEKINQEDKRN